MALPSMTLMQGKETTILEMEFCVVDFELVVDTVYKSDYADPSSILVLLTNDLVAIDCLSTAMPSYENPYAMDFQVRVFNIDSQEPVRVNLRGKSLMK